MRSDRVSSRNRAYLDIATDGRNPAYSVTRPSASDDWIAAIRKIITSATVTDVEPNNHVARRTCPVITVASAASEGRSRNARPELWIYGHEFAGSIDAGLDVIALDPASTAVVVARLEIGAIGAAVAVAVAAGCGALT